MSEISDEMLMAFADGELDAVQSARVEAYLRTSSDGVQRLDVFAATGRGLANLFDQPMLEPVPQHLIDAVKAEPVVHLYDAGRARAQRQQALWQRSSYVALAASLTVLAVGAGGFWLLNGSAPTDINYGLAMSETGERLAADALSNALETVASASKVTRSIAGDTATIEPVFTFATAGGGYCRQYVLTRSPESAFGGVACRTTGGQWRIEAHEPFTPQPAKDNQIVPASKDSMRSIDAIVDRMISGDVLSADTEASVITGGWQVPAP